MKKAILFLLLCLSFQTKAQKKLVDTSAYGQWPIVGCGLSNNGAYVFYNINNQPLGSNTLGVKATNGLWKTEFRDVEYGQFSPDSKNLVFLHKDTLRILTLGTELMTAIFHVESYQLAKNGKSSLLIYRLNNPGKQITLRDLNTGREQSFNGISGYRPNNNVNPTALLLQKEEGKQKTILQWLSLPGGELETIWQGARLSNIVFSPDGDRLAFVGQDSTQNDGKLVVWYYHSGDIQAKALETNNGEYLQADRLIKIDRTGNKLFFRQNEAVIKTKINAALSSVDIYSYKDPKLQSQQLLERSQTSFTYVYNIQGQRVVRLEQENEIINSPLDGDWVLVQHFGSGDKDNEWNWNKNAFTAVYLVSTVDGIRKCLSPKSLDEIPYSYVISPNGKYVIFYDPLKKDYFSYIISTGIIKNITKGLKVGWLRDSKKDIADNRYEAHGNVAGWTTNESAVLLNSDYDIFEADPTGIRNPISLTNGYGLKHHVEFSNVFEEGILSMGKWTVNVGQPILLHFINYDNKKEGFCRVVPGKRKDPEILSAQKYSLPANSIVKALDTNVYSFKLQSAENSPNYFLTTDFKKLKPLTDVHSEKNYNWLTVKLIHWKTPDGKNTQGMLYKPENFDPKKKYPVIFFYYRRLTYTVYHFLQPGYGEGGGTVDIPTYVSNGYLVFVPDIHYQIGYPGKSAYNTIMSGVQYLSHFHWVDTHHMGLMGHSFGGFETNYVITHSHLFAAAVSMSGMSDFVSAYGSVIGNGNSRQGQYENDQDDVGATLWQRPDLYLANSPVLRVDRVTSPVLLMANKKDDDVPYEQGFEFFTGLRRLGKKAWLLQYDNGGHQVGRKDERDLSIRIRQFFDYYLKGITPPKWMTAGIPANMKQIETGFEADNSGRKP